MGDFRELRRRRAAGIIRAIGVGAILIGRPKTNKNLEFPAVRKQNHKGDPRRLWRTLPCRLRGNRPWPIDLQTGSNRLLASLYWFSALGHWGVNRVFDSLYRGQSQSETFRGIYREVFGQEYPEEVDCSGFLTLGELRRFAEDLHAGPGQTFVDLACGRGGATLWLRARPEPTRSASTLRPWRSAMPTSAIASFDVGDRVRFSGGRHRGHSMR